MKLFRKKKKYLVIWCCQLHTGGVTIKEIIELNEDEEWIPCTCTTGKWCRMIKL